MRRSKGVPTVELRRYLLGQLPQADRERVELGLLGDAEQPERLGDEEDDLIEDYLGDVLDAEEVRSFESHFLASERRRQSLECARLVRDHHMSRLAAEEGAGGGASASRAPRTGLRRSWWLAAAVVALAAVAGLRLWIAAPPEPGRVARLTLVAGRTMGEADAPAVRFDPTRAGLEIEIGVEGGDAYERMRARLTGPDGRAREWMDLEAGAVVVLRIPSGQLAPGHHALALEGLGAGEPPRELGRWSFDILGP